MRKLLIGIFLASISVNPALAAPTNESDSDGNAAQHQSAPRHSGHSTPSATPQPSWGGHRHGGIEVRTPGSAGRANVTIMGPSGRATPAPRLENPGRKGPVTSGPIDRRPEIVQPRVRDRALRPISDRPRLLPDRPVISPVPRPATEPPLNPATRPTPKPNWSPTWRTDQRYDWHNWRHHHRHHYHLYPYYDPFGWGYYVYSIGWRLWPGYYGSQYWITDPWYYRLPPAPPGTHWVRYYNDVLLVDTWTGEIIDVIHNFFW